MLPQLKTAVIRDAQFEGFAQYLAAQIADQQQVIANLAPVDDE
jgi:hypothetical protein